MSDDFLKNPLSLFDIRGKSAVVTGASGAFGALAAKVLAGAGANVVLAAGKAAELKSTADECAALGAKVAAIASARIQRRTAKRSSRRPSRSLGGSTSLSSV